jgi:hypothetical protein
MQGEKKTGETYDCNSHEEDEFGSHGSQRPVQINYKGSEFGERSYKITTLFLTAKKARLG